MPTSNIQTAIPEPSGTRYLRHFCPHYTAWRPALRPTGYLVLVRPSVVEWKSFVSCSRRITGKWSLQLGPCGKNAVPGAKDAFRDLARRRPTLAAASELCVSLYSFR